MNKDRWEEKGLKQLIRKLPYWKYVILENSFIWSTARAPILLKSNCMDLKIALQRIFHTFHKTTAIMELFERDLLE